MQNLISKNPLVKKIVDGDVESEVFEMLFSRQLPFTEEEYLESLVSLIKRDQYKESALQQLKSIPQQQIPDVIAEYGNRSDGKHAYQRTHDDVLSERGAATRTKVNQHRLHGSSPFPISWSENRCPMSVRI